MRPSVSWILIRSLHNGAGFTDQIKECIKMLRCITPLFLLLPRNKSDVNESLGPFKGHIFELFI